MQNNARPMASPCYTPLEKSILRLSPEFIWKNRGEDLSPQKLVTKGVDAGTQVAASVSTAVRLTVLTALEQSVRIRQFFASWCVRARNATCSTPPLRTPPPNCLASRLISSSRGGH